tara:strand:+ start:313 stop:516 length:204 start_codon:yes stop_codon:yes gene_type:complete
MMRIKIKEKATGQIYHWSLEQVLEEINRDRSEDWTRYNKSDWREGWNEWIEGDIYNLISTTKENDDE